LLNLIAFAVPVKSLFFLGQRQSACCTLFESKASENKGLSVLMKLFLFFEQMFLFYETVDLI
jgi:hypothetical protein